MTPANPSPKLREVTPKLTLCLAMDLMGSTTAGLKLSTKKLDRFNLALVDQLSPYLELVQLDHTIVKFTGDGWLVMSDVQDDAAKLCCLAMIMSRRFQRDIVDATGFHRENVPSMRLAVCWGRDLTVILPGGTRDFVGNSVRHAVRACQLCQDNEILIDETVRSWIHHDFRTSRCDFEARLLRAPSAKMEEDLVLHVLEELKIESVDDADAPVAFVNTLTLIGRPNEADQIANRFSGRLVNEAAMLSMTEGQLLASWNGLLNSNLDHETARDVLSDLIRSGLKPDVSTYNALIEKSDSDLSERRWLQLMVEEGLKPTPDTLYIWLRKARSIEQAEERISILRRQGVVPDQRSLNLVVELAVDGDQAETWVDRFSEFGVLPDRKTYRTLIEKSRDFQGASRWLEAMIQRGWEPEEASFIDTFAKGVLGLSGEELLGWYLSLRIHPAHPIKRAIAEYRKAGRIDDALRLALDYPQTDTALKLIRQHSERAIAYFESVVAANPNHANGAYALAMAYITLGRSVEAAPWLRRAHDLATPGPRKDELSRYLPLVDTINPQAVASIDTDSHDHDMIGSVI